MKKWHKNFTWLVVLGLPVSKAANSPDCKKNPLPGAWVSIVGCTNYIFISFGGPQGPEGRGEGGLVDGDIVLSIVAHSGMHTHIYSIINN